MSQYRFNTWTGAPLVGDSFSNMLAGLGQYGRDRVTAQTATLHTLSGQELIDLYRGDWLARKIVDIPAFDSTRAWRHWNADKDDTQKLETTERQFGLQRKCMEAFVKARLYGGAAIVLGVKGAGDWNEELDLDKVAKGSLKFIHVVTGGRLPMIAAGALTRDITSPWFGEPTYYERSNNPILPAPGGVEMPKTISIGGANGFQMSIHPSRVVRLTGLDYPDMETAPDSWGDSVLQPVWDAVRDAGLVGQSIANLTSRANVNVIKVPGLSNKLGTTAGTDEVTKRFANANVLASVVNALLLDEDEEWNQLSVNFSQLPQIVQMYLLIGAAAADIPATRLLAREPAGQNATGDSDTRNYYDRLSSDQKVRITPLLSRLDEVLIRTTLGTRPAQIDYNWNPLWQLDDSQKADINLKNAQAFQIDNNAGLIDPIALKKGRENQLIANDVYPGLDQAINDAEGGSDGEDVDEQALARLGLDPDTHAALPPPELQRQLPPPGNGSRSNNGNAPSMQDAEQSALSFLLPGGLKRRRRRNGKAQNVRYPDDVIKASDAYRDALDHWRAKRSPENWRALQDAARGFSNLIGDDGAGGAANGSPFAGAKTLYVSRPLVDYASFRDWAKAQGFTSVLTDPHVTLLYSKRPMDWHAVPPDEDAILLQNNGVRSIEQLGDQGAVVLRFTSDDLTDRHNEFVEAGGSHDYDAYQPHITITYQAPPGLDLKSVTPYSGSLIFGPEEYETVSGSPFTPPQELTFHDDFDPGKHPRIESGPGGGQFAVGGGATGAAATAMVRSTGGKTPKPPLRYPNAGSMTPEQRRQELTARLEANAMRYQARERAASDLRAAMAAQQPTPATAGWVHRAHQFMDEPRSKGAVARASWEFVANTTVGVVHHAALHQLILPLVEGVVIGALAELGAPAMISAVAVNVATYAVTKLVEHSPLSEENAKELLHKCANALTGEWGKPPAGTDKPIAGGASWIATDADDDYADMLVALARLQAGLDALEPPDPGEALSDVDRTGLNGYISDDGPDDEARDETGRWTGGGGQQSAGRGPGGRADGSRSVQQAQADAARAAGGHQALAGLPQKPIELTPGRWYVPGPIGRLKQAAADYAHTSGIAYTPPTTYAKLNKDRAGKIAAAFDAMPHNPDDPHVKAAYAALAKETLAQWNTLKKTGLKVEWIKPGQADPYASSPRLAAMDVADNYHWWGFPTDQGFGSGPEAEAAMKDNPLLEPTGEVIDGRHVVVNDVFRIVHDLFGHLKEGNGFRGEGEENAWRSHSAMFSPLAREAMTTETRGQNSWVNYGPYGATNRKATAADTHYAPQKIGLLPEWAVNDGSGRPGTVDSTAQNGYISGDGDPDQPRDEDGRWTGSGGSSAAGQSAGERAGHGPVGHGQLPAHYGQRSPGRAARARHVAAVWEGGGASFKELSPAGAGLFHAAITKAKASSKYGTSVTVHAPAEYSHMRLFETDGDKAGFALDGNTVVSLFKHDASTQRGFAGKALALATQLGAKQLECFDTALPRLYSDAGFRAVARIPFDDQQKPKGWNYKTYEKYNGGRPDVVFMVHDPAHARAYQPGDGQRVETYADAQPRNSVRSRR